MKFDNKPTIVETDFTIRQAGVDDAVRLRLLRLESLLDAPNAFSADYQENEDRSVHWWEEKIQVGIYNRSDAVFIAETEGRLVGMSGIVRGRAPKGRHAGLIYGVFVQPSWRGQGIGFRILSRCLEWGEEQGLNTVRLAVAVDNTAAIRCYHRCGFRVYGVEKRSIQWESRFYDELLMDCLLD